MRDIEILDLMVKDHQKIVKLLKELHANFADVFEVKSKLFEKLKWGLEKHFFIEERAIFVFYAPQDETEVNIIPDLLKEHDMILEKLSELEEDLKTRFDTHFIEFQKLLMKNKTFEEGVFYPKLDQGLDENKKKIIIDRINSSF